MSALRAKYREIGLHWKGKDRSIYCACFGAKVVEGSDHTSEGKRQISSPRFLRRKRTEIGSYRN